jgi:hypothetical protein
VVNDRGDKTHGLFVVRLTLWVRGAVRRGLLNPMVRNLMGN